VGAVGSVAYALYALSRPPLMKLLALGARRPSQGEYLTTKRAMHDIAIAAGFADVQPHLFVLDSSSVNAFVLARGRERAYVVVTSGLAERFDVDEQRAVFANLMARLRAGDIHWGTVVSALMAPVWRWREADFRSEDPDLAGILLTDEFVAGDASSGPAFSATTARGGLTAGSEAAALVLPVWIAMMSAVIASEIVGLGHRRSHLMAAQVAGAEGMFLLKDPVAMLRTLKRAIEADNRVGVAAPLYAHLFYIWAGDDMTDEDDPEWERLRRLREVIGVYGMEDAARAEDPLLEGLPPAAPHAAADFGPLPEPRAIEVDFPQWAAFVPLVLGLVATTFAGGRLFQVANFGQPLLAGPGGAEWQDYAQAVLRAENVFVAVAVVSALVAGLASSRVWGGALSAGLLGLWVTLVELLVRSLTTVDLGRPLGATLGSALVFVAVAGLGGGVIGRLVWGRGAGREPRVG
jgi:hypothetical protein